MHRGFSPARSLAARPYLPSLARSSAMNLLALSVAAVQLEVDPQATVTSFRFKLTLDPQQINLVNKVNHESVFLNSALTQPFR